tara:strand:+ start:508 stop:1065 length:558 start_codon:yes stop_codon:yes gene_type:complete
MDSECRVYTCGIARWARSPYKAIQPCLCNGRRRGAGGGFLPCLYVKEVQKFLLVTGAQGLWSLSFAWQQQWDVLPQWIAIQGQWLLPGALSRAAIYPQQMLGGGRNSHRFLGVFTPDISVVDNVTARGVTGIGIYAKGTLEAVYTGGNLNTSQIQNMTTGDGSTTAMNNQMWSHWGDNTVSSPQA